MLEFFRGWVISIAILLLLIVLLEMIIPSGKMKKYISLVTGFILIIAIINPPLKYFGSGTLPVDMINLENNEMERRVIELDSRLLEKEQTRQITEVYRRKIISQLEYSSLEVDGVNRAKADVIINEDHESDSFGEIKRVYIEVSEKKESSISSELEKIKINIGDIVENEENFQDERAEGATLEKLREKISSIYGINKDLIIISYSER